MQFLRERAFWLPFGITAVIAGLFFAWELGALSAVLPSLPRISPSPKETAFALALALLLALNAGLFGYQKTKGSCPIGAKRATGIAGALGAAALICPACVIVPLTLFGTSVSLLFLAPFVPLLQIIALFLLIVSTVMMWPKQR